ncbi:MAG: sulfate adenylyltransferase [Armatimonadota bacterium]
MCVASHAPAHRNGSIVPGITPHGGHLVNREAPPDAELRASAQALPQVVLSRATAADLVLLGTGGYSPLEGFLCREDYRSVLATMRLRNGVPWPIPVVLSVDREALWRVKVGSCVALATADGQLMGTMSVEDVFRREKGREAELVYGTTDEAHPGVKAIYASGGMLIGGPITLLSRLTNGAYADYRLDPAQTRAVFAERGWRRVVGFQTRNPIHRAHEYLMKCALEIADGIFVNPLVGETKSGDIPPEVRMRCYRAVLDSYFPGDRYLLGVLDTAMRYAGPREAVFHALIRQNYGCTHFVVGRDHAGVGSYYSPSDAHDIFDQFELGEIAITPLCFDGAFYCYRCDGMATVHTCPHEHADRLELSGTRVRELLAAGTLPPRELTRPEVADLLLEAYEKGLL